LQGKGRRGAQTPPCATGLGCAKAHSYNVSLKAVPATDVVI